MSFGKDSLVILLLLREQHTPLGEVIFCSLEIEFQAIYDIQDRIKPVLEQRDIRLTEVKQDVPFLYNMLDMLERAGQRQEKQPPSGPWPVRRQNARIKYD